MNRKGQLEFKKKWLQWVLDFVQTDLDSLSITERKTLAIEICFFCSDDFFKVDWEDFKYNANRPVEAREDILNDILDKDLSEMERNPHSIQKELNYLVLTTEDLGLAKGVMRILPVTKSILYVGWLGDESNIFSRGEFLIDSIPNPLTLENYAIINFAYLMLGCDIHSIVRCKGCEKHILNLTQRRKIYCSFTCASRTIAHKRYEELKKDPKKYEAHLKKYRKYSSDRFRRLREEQYGPNVKINHRKKNRREV